MGIFQNNILKPEELFGGFDPSSEGDETFAINAMDNYPGDLPDFGLMDTFVEKESVPEIQEPTVAVQDPNEDIWGNFEQNEPVVSDPESTQDGRDAFGDMFPNDPSSPIAEVDPVVDEIVSSDGSEPNVPFEGELENDDELEQMLRDAMADENESVSTVGQDADENLDGYDLNQIFENAPEVIAAMDVEPSAPEPIMEEIPPIEQVITPEPIMEEIPPIEQVITPKKEFKEIKTTDGAVEISIDDVYPSHPSKTGIESKNSKLEKDQSPIDENKATPKADKKQIDRKLLKRISYIAAAIILLALVSSGVYYFGLVDTVTHWVSGDSHKDSTSLVQSDESKHTAELNNIEANQQTPKENNHNQQEIKLKDTVAPTHTQEETHIESAEQQHKKSEVVQIADEKHEDKLKKLPNAVEKKKSKSETKSIVEKKQRVTIVEPKKTKPVSVKSTEVVENIPKQRSSEIHSESNTQTEVYVIQIYSSPSKEDAQEWLKKVQKRIGSEAYISTQVIRDKVWYRVRCGNYSSKDAATAAAEKFGFSQSWVDRIR